MSVLVSQQANVCAFRDQLASSLCGQGGRYGPFPPDTEVCALMSMAMVS